MNTTFMSVFGLAQTVQIVAGAYPAGIFKKTGRAILLKRNMKPVTTPWYGFYLTLKNYFSMLF